MIIADLAQINGRVYPARRRTQNLVGGMSPIQASNFSMGNVTLQPNGGQVPWHNQEQEEIYFLIEGTAEMCLGEERTVLRSGQAVYIPSGVFHQLTNIGETSVPHVVLLWTGRRRCPLASRAGWHFAQGRHRRPAAACRRAPTVYGEA